MWKKRRRGTQMTVVLSLTAVWWLHLICLVGNETELQKLVLLATGSWQYFSSILSSLLGQSLLLGSQEWQQCRLCPVQMPASPPRPMFRVSQHNRSSKAMSYTWQNCLRQHYRVLLNPKPTQILISSSCFIKLIIANLWEQSQRGPAFPLTVPSAHTITFPFRLYLGQESLGIMFPQCNG